MKVFVPEDNVYNKCYVLQSEGVIRGYDKIPTLNTSYTYRDYYIKSDYIYREGTGNWGQYATLPICLDSSVITNEYYYRLDFTSVLINLLVISIFCFYVPFRVFRALLGRRLV